MSERTQRFTVEEPGRLEIRLGSGRVRVVPGDPGSIDIALSGGDASLERVTVEQRGPSVVVESTGKGRRWSRLDLVASVPEGIEVDLKLGSGGDVTIDQTVASIRAAIGAGDLRIDRITGDAVVKAAAGDITIGTVGGRLESAGASGDLRVDSVEGDLTAGVASGDVRVDRLAGSATVRTASGDVAIGRMDGPRLVVKTLSGDVTVGIPAGKTLEVDLQSLSGRVINRLEPDPDAPRAGTARIEAKSVSGDVILRPAQG